MTPETWAFVAEAVIVCGSIQLTMKRSSCNLLIQLRENTVMVVDFTEMPLLLWYASPKHSEYFKPHYHHMGGRENTSKSGSKCSYKSNTHFCYLQIFRLANLFRNFLGTSIVVDNYFVANPLPHPSWASLNLSFHWKAMREHPALNT